MIRSGIDFDRRPDPAWSRALARLAPRSRHVNWLHVAWFAGDPWAPVERWVVYEMTPWETIAQSQEFQQKFGFDDEFYRALTGPNPRTLGHFDRQLGAYITDGLPSLIDRRQWVMFRELNAFARPLWIIQGSAGGHKRFFTPMELRYLRTQGYPWDAAPAPGELAYAEFDERVVAQLAKLDRLRQWEVRRSWMKRTINDTFKARAQAETEFLKLFGTWLDRQIEGCADAMLDLIGDVNDLPYRDIPVEERERVDEALLEPETTYAT